MKRHLLIPIVLTLILTQQLDGQNLTNSNWKGFFKDPINDTIELHFQKDTFFVTNNSGDLLVRSTLKVSKDTMTITDFEGQYMCPQSDGVYRYTIENGVLRFVLVSDPCEGRNAITDITWTKVTKDSK